MRHRPPSRGEWWTDHREIAALITWLADRGEKPDDVAYLVEKPWKWTPEYDRMIDEQRAAGVDRVTRTRGPRECDSARLSSGHRISVWIPSATAASNNAPIAMIVSGNFGSQGCHLALDEALALHARLAVCIDEIQTNSGYKQARTGGTR